MPGIHNGEDLYYWFGTFDYCLLFPFENLLGLNTGGGCFDSVWDGMSGSGAYFIDNDNRYVHAICSSRNDNHTVGRYCKLWEQAVIDLVEFENLIRGDVFDLEAMMFRVDGDTTVEAGSSLPESTVQVINATNADPINHIYTVRVYLSTDNNISESDTQLAEWGYAVDFGPMENWTFIVPAPTIPANTPAGTYWVGVVLDSNTDLDVSNNDTDTWDAQQISVTPGTPTGACCFVGPWCTLDTQAGCLAAGGIYQGDGTSCGGVNCRECLSNSDCDDGDPCTDDSCDPGTGNCVNTLIIPCCGNGVPEPGEDCSNCPEDVECPPGTKCIDGRCESTKDGFLYVPAEYPTIQDAINAASDGHEVIVAPGTYPETINFLGKAITLRSSGGPEVTFIDAQGTGTVVTCASGEGQETVLDGFTITGGSADFGGGMINFIGTSPMVNNCIFTANAAASLGGEMCNFSASPTVTNTTFAGNSAENAGGGMCNYPLGDPPVGSNPNVTACTFSGNTASLGGGMFTHSLGNSNATIMDSSFCENTPDHVTGPWTDAGGNCFADTCDDSNGNGVPDECECTGDLDGDGNVGVSDLLIFLPCFGSPADDCANPYADINGDGYVNAVDLTLLLVNWGPCP